MISACCFQSAHLLLRPQRSGFKSLSLAGLSLKGPWLTWSTPPPTRAGPVERRTESGRSPSILLGANERRLDQRQQSPIRPLRIVRIDPTFGKGKQKKLFGAGETRPDTRQQKTSLPSHFVKLDSPFKKGKDTKLPGADEQRSEERQQQPTVHKRTVRLPYLHVGGKKDTKLFGADERRSEPRQQQQSQPPRTPTTKGPVERRLETVSSPSKLSGASETRREQRQPKAEEDPFVDKRTQSSRKNHAGASAQRLEDGPPPSSSRCGGACVKVKAMIGAFHCPHQVSPSRMKNGNPIVRITVPSKKATEEDARWRELERRWKAIKTSNGMSNVVPWPGQMTMIAAQRHQRALANASRQGPFSPPSAAQKRLPAPALNAPVNRPADAQYDPVFGVPFRNPDLDDKPVVWDPARFKRTYGPEPDKYNWTWSTWDGPSESSEECDSSARPLRDVQSDISAPLFAGEPDSSLDTEVLQRFEEAMGDAFREVMSGLAQPTPEQLNLQSVPTDPALRRESSSSLVSTIIMTLSTSSDASVRITMSGSSSSSRSPVNDNEQPSSPEPSAMMDRIPARDLREEPNNADSCTDSRAVVPNGEADEADIVKPSVPPPPPPPPVPTASPDESSPPKRRVVHIRPHQYGLPKQPAPAASQDV
ncbi:Uu.00g063810.m01.CDS01 [Anthostomella pinea]|uniref:Uu.00g063810.m01.CDS01 n=1 Tax=Anthostomella pinea TaxID=933095 RepID=A0AAI8VTF4_9PEZI|nr:Uu.00g063810.m01.CDS01 [Anthostomella pinea]